MSLAKCKECGHEVAKSAAACPGCGVKLRSQRKVLGFIFAALLFLPVFAFFGWGLVNYGTVAPCEMAAKEIVAQAMQLADETGEGGYGLLGRGGVAALAERDAQSRLAGLGPTKCVRVLWILRTEGLPSTGLLVDP